MKRYYLLLLVLFILGCNYTHNKHNKNTITVNKPQNKAVCVDVFTLAPLREISIVDNKNSFATFYKTLNKYCFLKPPVYPIKVIITDKSYIDLDYDNKKTSFDAKLDANLTLKSFCPYVNLITTLFYTSYLPEYEEQNISITKAIKNYKNLVFQKYNVDICNPASKLDYYKLLFASFNYSIANNYIINSLDDFEKEYSNIENLFKLYPLLKNEKYYSAYRGLELFDKKLLKRVDNIHKPYLPSVLGIKEKDYDVNNYIDAFDLKVKDGFVHIAAGQDEYALMQENNFSNYAIASNIAQNSFGSKIHIQELNKTNKCIYISSNKAGISVYKNNVHKGYFSTYLTKDGTKKFGENVINIKSYISGNANKRFLAILTDNKGMYLINQKYFNDCMPNKIFVSLKDKNITTYDINSSRDFLITEDQSIAYDMVFSKDGSFLYRSSNKAISKYSLESLDDVDILNSKTDFKYLAYTLALFRNNALIAGNDKGILIFKILNNKDLSLNSTYYTEGAKTNYHPVIKTYKDFIIFSDGYYGIKVLKIDNKLNPMLCGVRYFDINNVLSRVKAIEMDKDYIIVSTDYKIEKIYLRDILFNHCKDY